MKLYHLLTVLFLCHLYYAEAQQPPGAFRAVVQTMQVAPLGGIQAEIVTNPLDKNTTHVKITFDLSKEVQQDDWQVNITPAFRPSFHWSPHLTPTDNHIIDQHVFRSPAMLVSDESHVLTVIPDLDIMKKGTPVRWYMDLDAAKNVLTLVPYSSN